jgi:hypothetical protein
MSDKTGNHEVTVTFTAAEYLGLEALAQRYNKGSISEYLKERVRQDMARFALATTEDAKREP